MWGQAVTVSSSIHFHWNYLLYEMSGSSKQIILKKYYYYVGKVVFSHGFMTIGI